MLEQIDRSANSRSEESRKLGPPPSFRSPPKTDPTAISVVKVSAAGSLASAAPTARRLSARAATSPSSSRTVRTARSISTAKKTQWGQSFCPSPAFTNPSSLRAIATARSTSTSKKALARSGALGSLGKSAIVAVSLVADSRSVSRSWHCASSRFASHSKATHPRPFSTYHRWL